MYLILQLPFLPDQLLKLQLMLLSYVSNNQWVTYIVIFLYVNFAAPNISTSAQPVEILSSQSTVLECIPSNPELSIRWVLYQTDGSRIPITFDDSGLFDRVPEVKRNVQLLPSIETRFPHHNITITSADVSLHSGLYVCSIDTPHRDPTVISRNITVDVLPGQLIASYLLGCQEIKSGACV